MKDEAILPLARPKRSRAPSPEPISDAWGAEGPRGLRARALAWLGLGPAPAKPSVKPSSAKVPRPTRTPGPGGAKTGQETDGAAARKERAEMPASRPAGRQPRPSDISGTNRPTPGKRRRAVGARRAVQPIESFLLVIGAMKSGTTSLYDYLATHPEIAPCRRKEPSFFAADKRPPLLRRYYRLWPDYDPARHRYAMEASVDYTKQPRYRAVAQRIAGFPARFRYIYIVRDPVDRIESHIAHNIAKGRVTAGDYDKMLPSALSISRYGYQLDSFRAGVGKPEVLLLDFDELRHEPRALLARVVDFLGIDPGFAFAPRPPSNTRRSESAGFRLSPEERARFRAELAPDMARFAKVYGFDVARWGFTPEAYPEAFAAAARLAPAPEPERAAAAPAAIRGDQRRDLVYHAYLRTMMSRLAATSQSLIDVGSRDPGLSEEFDWIPERFALDRHAPYSSEKVTGIPADFLTFEPGRRYDFATCLLALEHVPEAGAFARKLLAVSDRVLVAVPYNWPPGKHAEHVHDPVNKVKLAGWFGREPDYQLVVREPLRQGSLGHRLIAYFHNVPGETFSLRALPPRPRRGPENAPALPDAQRPA